MSLMIANSIVTDRCSDCLWYLNDEGNCDNPDCERPVDFLFGFVGDDGEEWL